MFPDLLKRVKTILEFEWDIDNDDLLAEFISNFVQAVNLYIGSEELPAELEFVVIEATISRYNRLGSEGFKSENIDVISITYIEDILEPWIPYLDAYKKSINKVKFL